MSDESNGFLSRMTGRIGHGSQSNDESESLPEKDERADWDADDSGVTNAGFHYEDSQQEFEWETDEVGLDIHANPGNGIMLVVSEHGDDPRSLYFHIDHETADEVAPQLELAAEKLRDGKGADVRL